MKKFFLWSLGIFFAIWLFGVVLSQLPGSNKPNMSHVRYHCQEAVEKRLKAPSTASFSGQYETTIYEVTPSQRYRVAGYVDAQNSFGAKLRKSYSCTVSTYSSGNDRTYVVDALSF